MARTPKNASIEKIETAELITLDYLVPPSTVTTAFLVLSNLTANILDISVYINDSVSDFLLMSDKIPGGMGKTLHIKELSLEKLNAGFTIKVQSTTNDAFNAFLSVSEISDN